MNKKKKSMDRKMWSDRVVCCAFRAVYLGPRYLTDLSGNVYMFAIRIAYRPASGCRYSTQPAAAAYVFSR